MVGVVDAEVTRDRHGSAASAVAGRVTAGTGARSHWNKHSKQRVNSVQLFNTYYNTCKKSTKTIFFNDKQNI